MALCTSCGNEVDESASFCTSCGKAMPAAAHPSAAVSATRPVCSSCGAQGDPGSLFCTECGKRLIAEATPRGCRCSSCGDCSARSGDGCANNFTKSFLHIVWKQARARNRLLYELRAASSQQFCCRGRTHDERCDSGTSVRSYAAGSHRTCHCASSQRGAKTRSNLDQNRSKRCCVFDSESSRPREPFSRSPSCSSRTLQLNRSLNQRRKLLRRVTSHPAIIRQRSPAEAHSA